MARGRTGRSGRSKGEINEIVGQLEKLSALDGRKSDVIQAKRDCFQKLIRYMTTGIDMSAAFIPATKCVALSKSDLPLKKMLYLYLRSAARQNAAVALLVVQTLLTDAKDADPTIRGLAVRSMCSLRVPELMENVFAAVDAGLTDQHPYVREVSVIGILKCHHQDPGGTKVRGYAENLRSMLATDTDPQVVANCLYVLQQLGMLNATVITRPLVVSLLNHIRSFSDWAQCLVLEVMLKYYRPASESERFDVLEILDFGLNHTNSAVIMGTAKLFLHYTSNYPDQYTQVLASIKGPMQTLLLGREPEIVYAALSNLILLAQRHPSVFSDLAADCFCRPEDPSYLKLLKLEALVAVADASNAFDAAEEAAQYARDPEAEVARAAVHAVAQIALKVAEVDGILDRLLLFLNHGRKEVAEEAVAAMADVLRRFPGAADACVPAIAEVDALSFELPAARAAFVWVLGEFGHTVQDAPYTLEAMAQDFSQETPQVKLALLTAIAKLFFKRAPECKAALGIVLAAGSTDSDTEVQDRAQFYYRLFSEAGPDQAKAVIAAPRPAIARFSESQPAEVQDRIFDEWNSLSTVYRAPAATFVDPGDIGEHHETDSIGGGDGPGSDEGLGSEAIDGGTALLLDLGDGEGSESGTTPPQTAGPSSETSSVSDLLALGLGGSGGGGGSAAVASSSAGAGGGLGNLLGGSSTSPLPGTSPPVSSATGFDMFTQPAARVTVPQPQHAQQQASGLDMLGDLLGSASGNTTTSAAGGGAPVPPPAAPAPALADDLDVFFGGLGGSATNTATSAPPPPPSQAPQHQIENIDLVSKPSISATEYQILWAQCETSGTVLASTQELAGGASSVSNISARGFREFSDHIGQANLNAFATPKEGSSPPFRFLLHAQRQGGTAARVLAQVVVSAAGEPSAEIIVKSVDAAAASHVQELLQTLLLTI